MWRMTLGPSTQHKVTGSKDRCAALVMVAVVVVVVVIAQ